MGPYNKRVLETLAGLGLGLGKLGDGLKKQEFSPILDVRMQEQL